jgi:hypothetical protein
MRGGYVVVTVEDVVEFVQILPLRCKGMCLDFIKLVQTFLFLGEKSAG